jgi:hypothetical protein
MIRKTFATALFFLALGQVRAADWKTEVLSYLGPRPDYRRAMDFLTEQAKSLEAGDRQTAEALIPYLARKLGNAAEEQSRISDYFEKYMDNDPEFGFLDDITHRDFLNFWARWKSTYPLVSDINFLSRFGNNGGPLPAEIDIGLELLNDAYYRLSLGPYALEGGFWPRGFHILTVPAASLFDRSGTFEFALDLKAGDIIIRKPVRLEVNLLSVVSDRAPAPVLPPVQDGTKVPPGSQAATTLEGEVSLYVGGKLIMTSRKIAARPRPINIPIPGPSMRGTKPYLPPPKTDPMANSVSILDAIALTYQALKELFAKKPPPPSAPVYQKVSGLSYSFTRTAEDGTSSDLRANVRLDRARGVILRQ